MTHHKTIPQELLDKLVYDETSPSGLSWKERPARWRKSTLNAGCELPTGYYQINIKGFGGFAAHRLVWALQHGDPGGMDVDHIDHNPGNNRIENLQCIPHSSNMLRKRGRGCTYQPGEGTWLARITVGGQTRRLGTFATEEEARAAYVKAKKEVTAGLQVELN